MQPETWGILSIGRHNAYLRPEIVLETEAEAKRRQTRESAYLTELSFLDIATATLCLVKALWKLLRAAHVIDSYQSFGSR